MPDPLSPGPLTTKVAETLVPVVPTQVIDDLGAIAVTYDRVNEVYGSVSAYLLDCGVTKAQLRVVTRHLLGE